jgi:hypothetical protein
MKWLIALIAGFMIGALVFVPKFRDVVFDLVLGDMIVKICPGDNGVIFNGNFRLPDYVREDFTAVCTDWTKKFKDMAEEVEQTSWSEYLATSELGSTAIAMLEAEEFLKQNNWTKTREGGDDESYKMYFEKDDQKIIVYTFDSATDNNHMFFITGN